VDIALLNMMPDAALKATDLQFARLLAHHKHINLHKFTYPEIVRSEKAATYVRNNYQSENQIKSLAPDALIITGTNVSNPNLETQCFWEPLRETMRWAKNATRSTLCSCLASHAVMQFRYEQMRSSLPEKIWGIYEHEVMLSDHPLATGLPKCIPVPQSRYNEVTPAQFAESGLDIIIADSIAGVHLVASQDNSLVLMQGHPEYDGVSLLKEYKREVWLFADGERPDFPPLPTGILNEGGVSILESHTQLVQDAVAANKQPPEFPEQDVICYLHESWQPTASMVFDNWLKLLV